MKMSPSYLPIRGHGGLTIIVPLWMLRGHRHLSSYSQCAQDGLLSGHLKFYPSLLAWAIFPQNWAVSVSSCSPSLAPHPFIFQSNILQLIEYIFNPNLLLRFVRTKAYILRIKPGLPTEHGGTCL